MLLVCVTQIFWVFRGQGTLTSVVFWVGKVLGAVTTFCFAVFGDAGRTGSQPARVLVKGMSVLLLLHSPSPPGAGFLSPSFYHVPE